MVISFCHSVRRYDSKPNVGAERLQYRSEFVQEDIAIEQIAELCGQGFCWRAGIYDCPLGDKAGAVETFNKGGVRGNRLLALDFDQSNTAPDGVIEYSREIGLPASFWYYSFSQDPKECHISPTTEIVDNSNRMNLDNSRYKDRYNFRVVYHLDVELTPDEYERAYRLMLKALDRFSPDKATKDCSRLWFGGALGANYLGDDAITKEALGRWGYQEKVRNGTRPDRAIRQKRDFVPDYTTLEAPETTYVRNNWWEPLRGRCPLWDSAINGEYLDYNQRITLLGNLRFLSYRTHTKSVQQDVIDLIYAPYKDVYEGHTFDERQIREKFRDKALRPVPIVRGKGGNWLTIGEYLSDDQESSVIPQVEKTTPEELDRWMDEHVPAILTDTTANIQVLKSQPASGKTQRVIDTLFDPEFHLECKKIIYSAPRHSNLAEFKKRFLAKAGFTQTELIHSYAKGELSKSDEILLSLGLPARTKSYDKKEFIEKLFDPEEKGLFLITHSLLTALTGIRVDEIIIDESIDSSLVTNTHLSLSSLHAMTPYVGDRETRNRFSGFCNDIQDRRREDGIEIDLSFLRDEIAPTFERNIDAYISGVKAKELCVGFFDCRRNDGKLTQDENGMNQIRIVKRSTLIDEAMKNGTPIRILTATPMDARTRKYYPNADIETIKAPVADTRGKIIQYRGNTGARGNVKALAEYIKEKLPEDVIKRTPLITFKENRNTNALWKSEGFLLAKDDAGNQIHLANNSGLDLFKGRSLIIAGKFDYPDSYYQELWDDVGDGTKLTKANVPDTINGVSQTMFLYTNECIRKVQLENIRQYVEQATGRARALREDGVTVYVFCNYPIEDADYVYD